MDRASQRAILLIDGIGAKTDSLAPFLSPFFLGHGPIADVVNYIVGFIFGTIEPMA
jgi:hypothetical protein